MKRSKLMRIGDQSHENTHLNPFEIVEDYDEEADVLVGLLAAMAAPTQSLTDFQMANLKRQTRELWEKKGRAMLVDDVAAALKNHEDRRVQDVGEQLYPFTTQGEYGRFFNGHNNIRFKNRFTVLELEELKGRKHLQQVVLLQLIYQIQQEMYLGERDRRKIVFIDEAWDLLTQGDVGKFIETGYRRFRKYGGSAVTVTQSVNDLYDSPTGKAIAENSANMYLLGQKAETINALKKEGRLPLGEGGYEYLKTVHTVTGVYSEIFFITEMGTGIGRLIVDPFHKLLYSSRAEDVNAIKQLTRKGLSVADAISQLLKERGFDE
ncbi:ATP-binding protein [Pseudoalteromonas sp. S1688]|uniref:TraG/VirB4 family ATPase n=1 Tax=Pseudoalteromonas sp. S1688 TaxID=579511 RepID=UPI0032D569F5